MLNFLLLLLYSILPGISKILASQLVFALNIPIIFFLFFLNYKKNRLLNSNDVLIKYFLFYIIVQTVLCLTNDTVNEMGVFTSIYLYLIPFVGYFYAKFIDFDKLVKQILYIGVIHLFIGIVFYPAFGIGEHINPYNAILREGTMPDRMSSTSGSLGFGALFLIVFGLACYSKKNIFIFISCLGVFFSMQRSAWVGSIIIAIIFFLPQLQLQRGVTVKKLKNIFAILVLIFSIGVAIIYYLPKLENFDFINSRFTEVSSAADDRTSQWDDGLTVFFDHPFGVGLGQVGQVAARYEKNINLPIVSDGDFIRIFVELGIGAFFFYLWLYWYVILSLLKIRKATNLLKITTALLVGFFIQMIGSNITEFYFTNFLYWVIIGFYFKELKNASKKN